MNVDSEVDEVMPGQVFRRDSLNRGLTVRLTKPTCVRCKIRSARIVLYCSVLGKVRKVLRHSLWLGDAPLRLVLELTDASSLANSLINLIVTGSWSRIVLWHAIILLEEKGVLPCLGASFLVCSRWCGALFESHRCLIPGCVQVRHRVCHRSRPCHPFL